MGSRVAEFGSQFAPRMAFSRYTDGQWSPVEMVEVNRLDLHPATHVLHYASECFEGLKAYQSADSQRAHIFRLEQHVERMRRSAAHLLLPQPSVDLLTDAIMETVRSARAHIPAYPGSLYLRPTLFGADANIGSAAKASQSAIFYVLASPVGDYFTGGVKPLRILVDDTNMRCAPGFGQVKTGGNYAAALRHVVEAKERHGADQVLFCPGGDVQETAAANFLLIHDDTVITKPLDGSILAGVTRDSLLTLARDIGLSVQERDMDVRELMELAPHSEAALSGTAAVLTPVGSLLYNGREVGFANDGQMGHWTERLRSGLTSIQSGDAQDSHGWRTVV